MLDAPEVLRHFTAKFAPSGKGLIAE
jgi:hypothetical protein